MKAKRLLSVLLTLAIVASMTATLGITASALAPSYASLAEMQNGTATLSSSKTQATGTQIICDVYDTVTITVTPNAGYKVKSVTNSLFDVVATTTANVYRFSTLNGTSNSTVTVLFEPDNSTVLNTANNTAELEQNYNLTVTAGTKTDVNKVKVEWTVSDITATRNDAKKWNPDSLCWIDDDENDEITVNNATATFKITNLSSVKIDAKVEFAAVTGFTPEVVYTGVDATTHKTTVNTVVKADKNVDNTITHDVTVTVKVTPAKADFAEKSATSVATKYGTYTVTVSKTPVTLLTPTVTAPTANELTYNAEAQELVTAGNTSGGTLKYALGNTIPSDEDYSTSIPTATAAGEYTVWYKVFGNEEYESTIANIIDVIISKLPVTVTAPIANELTYNESEQELITAGSTTAGTLKYAVGDDEPEDEAYSTAIPTATEAGDYTVWYKSFGDDIYVTSLAESIVVTIQETDCLAKGTKITMADGTLKNIEDIAVGDEVLTYNHEEGRYEAQKVYLAWKCKAPKRAFTLHFTNGIEISVIGDHCFFEKESLSYVAVFESTAKEYIGKHFYNAKEERYEELLSVTYGETPVEYYEIYTEYNANCIAENMLNVAYDTSEILNIYEFNEDLTVDREQLDRDIAEYGIFEYVENGQYSEELYDMLRWKYLYVMIGKGFGTREDFNARRDAFLAE